MSKISLKEAKAQFVLGTMQRQVYWLVMSHIKTSKKLYITLNVFYQKDFPILNRNEVIRRLLKDKYKAYEHEAFGQLRNRAWLKDIIPWSEGQDKVEYDILLVQDEKSETVDFKGIIKGAPIFPDHTTFQKRPCHAEILK